MILSDTLRLALGNLRQSKLRTALTALGVSIGIASLIGMVSLGVGLQDQLLGRFMQSGVFDAITVTGGGGGNLPAFLGGAGGRRGGRGGGRGGRGGRDLAEPGAAAPSRPEPPALDDAALATLAGLANVKDVFPAIRVPLQIKLGEFQEAGTALGIPMSAKDEGAFRTMTSGAFFANDTDETCLLSLDVAKRINAGDPKSLVGQWLTLSYTASTGASTPMPLLPGMPSMPGLGALMQVQRVDRSYRIEGIVEREPGANMGGFGFASVMIPLPRAVEIDASVIRSAQALLADPSTPKKKTYSSVTVKVARAQYTEDVEAEIKALGYTAFSLNDALQGAKRAFILIDILLSLIGSIALAVSSLGIVNTMVMSILERTREIGVMKAIGASDADIRRIFLVEASAIGVLGGVAGLALGWLVARGVNIAANIYIVRQGGEAGNLFSFPFWLVGGALAFAWLISLLAGSYPANRAAKLNPIQALRHD
ncbi:MAG: FtsX-like permease family protein [Acidobacteriota bacterium]